MAVARILVVEDDNDVRATVERMLRSGGHEVVAAADGGVGIRLFREQSFDLVLCDVHMPGRDGIEVVAEIRRSHAIPIIQMTGSAERVSGGARLDPRFLPANANAGTTKVIAKPFRARELLALVQQCIPSPPDPV
jgi:CheY-like chemotaxis protein